MICLGCGEIYLYSVSYLANFVAFLSIKLACRFVHQIKMFIFAL